MRSSGFYGAREDNRGRHTDNPTGRHPIWTTGALTSIIPTIFMPDALPATTLPIYPGLGQPAPSMQGCIPSHLVHYKQQQQQSAIQVFCLFHFTSVRSYYSEPMLQTPSTISYQFCCLRQILHASN